MLSFTIMGAFGSFSNFINLYLERTLGFTGSQIGLVVMISMGLIIIINPILGIIGDKTGLHVLMLKIAFFMSTIFMFLLSNSSGFGLVLLILIGFEISRACIAPFIDLIMSNFCTKNKVDFGRVRVYSSIGFMITVMSVGFMIGGLQIPWFNSNVIGFSGFLSIGQAMFFTAITFFFVSFLLMFFVPKPDKKTNAIETKIKISDITTLLKNKEYQFIIIFIILSLVALESSKTFVGNHLVIGLGAGENIVSIMTFMMVLPEFILIPQGSRLIRFFGVKKWYIFSMVTMLIRLLVYATTQNITLFALASLLHGVGVATHISGNIAFIRRVVSGKILGLAFTIMVSIIAFSRAILSFVNGWLYEVYDGFAVFKLAAFLVFLGLLWVIKSKSLGQMSRSDV